MFPLTRNYWKHALEFENRIKLFFIIYNNDYNRGQSKVFSEVQMFPIHMFVYIHICLHVSVYADVYKDVYALYSGRIYCTLTLQSTG